MSHKGDGVLAIPLASRSGNYERVALKINKQYKCNYTAPHLDLTYRYQKFMCVHVYGQQWNKQSKRKKKKTNRLIDQQQQQKQWPKL